ncbi:unnamed protein product [Toxocara canis]|uniref:Secreted protein n=1 Tax=Toxocara canis TaxID=6265 RepID=A0A183UCD5_TOXCA|nr:unnamed protein product [Toxocara canis]
MFGRLMLVDVNLGWSPSTSIGGRRVLTVSSGGRKPRFSAVKRFEQPGTTMWMLTADFGGRRLPCWCS